MVKQTNINKYSVTTHPIFNISPNYRDSLIRLCLIVQEINIQK